MGNEDARSAAEKLGGARRAPMRRAMRVLEWMVENGGQPAGVREVARALELAPSTTHQLLATMEDAGMVEREPDGRSYALTVGLYRLCAKFAGMQDPIRRVLRDECQRLQSDTGEAAYAGLYEPSRDSFMYVEYVESSSPINYVMPLFEWIPLLRGGAGSLSIAAFIPHGDQDELVKAMVGSAGGEMTQGRRERLMRELAGVREKGYVVSVGRRIDGAAGIGAAVFGPGDRVIGPLVLALPEDRLARYDDAELGRAVADAARRASAALGS